MGEVRVRYHAAARNLAGRSEEEVPLAFAVPVERFLALLGERHPRLGGHVTRMRLAVNGDFAEAGAAVRAGDEVDVLPPVAGGAPLLCAVRDAPLSIDEAVAAVRHPSAGGICIFVGVVRDHADGKSVVRLDYEAHRALAEKEMVRILDAVAAEHDGVRIAATHRVGELAVGDLAVVVAASAAHRAEAFAACRAAIERIKETVPIWKRESIRRASSRSG